MTATIAPEIEALTAIVDRINAGTTYTLPRDAEYLNFLLDPLEDVNELRVDVVHEGGEDLSETLAVEDPTTHIIRVWVRKRIDRDRRDDIAAMLLTSRLIFQQVNTMRTDTDRVQVWESEMLNKTNPVKATLRDHGLFIGFMLFRVEVRPS